MRKSLIVLAAIAAALSPAIATRMSAEAAPAYSPAALAKARALMARPGTGNCTGPQFQAMVNSCINTHCNGGVPSGFCINECIQRTLVACGA